MVRLRDIMPSSWTPTLDPDATGCAVCALRLCPSGRHCPRVPPPGGLRGDRRHERGRRLFRPPWPPDPATAAEGLSSGLLPLRAHWFTPFGICCTPIRTFRAALRSLNTFLHGTTRCILPRRASCSPTIGAETTITSGCDGDSSTTWSGERRWRLSGAGRVTGAPHGRTGALGRRRSTASPPVYLSIHSAIYCRVYGFGAWISSVRCIRPSIHRIARCKRDRALS